MTDDAQGIVEHTALVNVLAEGAGTFICPRCSQEKPIPVVDSHMCAECAKVENSRYSHLRLHQDWLPIAQEAGIDPWMQQPGETQWEYSVWCAYRDSYPGKKPSYSEVARQLGTTYAAVKKVSQRWTFPMRMQLWMKNVDDMTLAQRRTEILEMNQSHISLAKKIRDKADKYIDVLTVETMKPGDMVQMMKLAAELERSARIDSIVQDDLHGALMRGDENQVTKRAPTSVADLGTVVNILSAAGVLVDTTIGIRQTTEVVIKGQDSIEPLQIEEVVVDDPE